MSKRISEHIRSNVVGYIAIFMFAIGGAAYANHPGGANTISSGDIIDGSVKAADVGSGQVKTADIGAGQVTAPKVATNAITNANLADNAVGAPEIANGAVGSAEVADNSLGASDVDESTLDSSVLQRRVTDSCPPGESIRAIDATGTAVTCETVGGGGTPTGPAGGDLAGSSYPDPTIAAGAISGGASGKISDDTITDDDLAGAAQFNGAAAGGDLAGTYPNPGIAADAVGSAEVAFDSLTSADLGFSSVGSAEVAFDSLTSVDLAGSSVNSLEIATSAVGSDEVASDSLTSLDLAADSVGSSEVAAGSLTTSDLASGAPGKFTGAAFPDPCDPGAAFLSCGAVSLNLPAAGSVLLQGSAGFIGTASGADTGTCQISEDPGTTAIGGNMTFGQAGSEHNSSERADGFALSAFDTGNTAGLHTWTLLCNETAGAVQVRDPKLSAIYLR